jgi:hypothetical protein
MSVILRCTNDQGIIQDIGVQEDLDIRLDISAIENATIGDVYGISSQEFTIPGDNEVNQFFGNLYNLGATPAVALQDSIPCQVLFNGAEVFKGKLYIKNIISDQFGLTLYNVIVVNETVDFKFEIQDLYLSQLDFSRFNHSLTYANISQSWGGGLYSGSIVYPFANYGQPEGVVTGSTYAFTTIFNTSSNTIDNYRSPLTLLDFKPAIKAKDVIDVIFSSSQYEYTSSFFNSSFFNNLYVLSTADDQKGVNNISPVSQSAWAYVSSSVQTISANTQTGIDFDAEIVDNANNFNLTTDRYTADTIGDYTYQVNINFTVGNWAFTTTDRVFGLIRKNGSTIIDTTNVIGPPATGSVFIQGTTSLLPGDYLEVELGFINPSGTRFLTIINDQGQPSYIPNGYNTYFQVKGPASIIGANVNMAQQFASEYKALDFIQGLIEKFNLVVEPVINRRNFLRIEPYQSWIDNGAQKDWSNKIDRNERISITHPITEQPRTILFSDEEDDDVLNEYTRNKLDKIFGQYEFISDSDLAVGSRRIGRFFAATPVTGIPNGRAFIVPHLCTVTDNGQFRPMKFKPRLLYNNGVQPVPTTAYGISGSGFTRGTIFIQDENADIQSTTVFSQMSTFGSVGVVNVDYATTQDLHFNNDQFSQFFQSTANGKVKNDDYRTYWATYINSLYDIDARKLVCNVYLKPTEIQDINLNDRIWIDGAYYRINRINGANLTRRDSVEVELIKIIANQLKFPRRVTLTGASVTVDFNSLSINGTGRYVNTETGEFVDNYAELVNPGTKDGFRIYDNAGTGSVVWDYQLPLDNTNQFDQKSQGTNSVDIGASRVNTIGSANTIEKESDTALIVGNNNLLAQNTNNATMIGESHTINQESSNIQLIGGIGSQVTGSNNFVAAIVPTNTIFQNNDNVVSINGDNDAIRDSDYTTAINSHLNEVIINGSGHTVIGLNLEGGGLDLLNTRNNSNWLGDTYLGGAIFGKPTTLQLGSGTNVSLTGSLYKHDSIFVLNWSGLSPGTSSIELPSYANDDYENIIYTFKANGTFNGTTRVEITGFGGTQLIQGNTKYAFSSSYDKVTLLGNSGSWLAI